MQFEQGLRVTVDWFRDNARWVSRARSGAYRESYDLNYGNR